jgi:hypothetical protein
MGVVIGTCIKHPGGPTPITGTDVCMCLFICAYVHVFQ